MNYPFNAGDLICCGQLSNNYLENNVKVRACCGHV
jgi:dynein heavy chain